MPAGEQDIYVLDMQSSSGETLEVWGVDRHGKSRVVSCSLQWATDTFAPLPLLQTLCKTVSAKLRDIYTDNVCSSCLQCARATARLTSVRRFDSVSSSREEMYSLRVVGPALCKAQCVLGTFLRNRTVWMSELASCLVHVHLPTNGIMYTTTRNRIGGWVTCKPCEYSDDVQEVTGATCMGHVEPPVRIVCVAHVRGDEWLVLSMDHHDTYAAAGGSLMGASVSERVIEGRGHLLQTLVAEAAVVVGFEMDSHLVQDLWGMGTHRSDMRKPLVLDVKTVYASMSKSAVGLCSGYKMGTTVTDNPPCSLSNLAQHDLGKPVRYTTDELENARAALRTTACLERSRGMLRMLFAQQANTFVSISAGMRPEGQRSIGRPSRLLNMLIEAVNRSGYVYDLGVAEEDADMTHRGGLNYHTAPRVYLETIELDFRAHYPNTCIAGNISREMYSDKVPTEKSEWTEVIEGDLCTGDGCIHGEGACDPTRRPFHLTATGRRYMQTTSPGVIPALLKYTVDMRARHSADAAEYDESGDKLAAERHRAVARWFKEEGCSIPGVMASKTGVKMRDYQTARDVYAASRGHLAVACNFVCSHFATCGTCTRTHLWANGQVESAPSRRVCKEPRRAEPLLLVSVVTDSLRLKLSPGDSNGGPDKFIETADWICAEVQRRCFAHKPPVQLTVARCDKIYLPLKDRSYFTLPIKGATDPANWGCKGRTLCPGSGTVAHTRLIRGVFAAIAAEHVASSSLVLQSIVAEITAGMQHASHDEFELALQTVKPVAPWGAIERLRQLIL